MKYMIKISIGTIALIVFCTIGMPMFDAQSSVQQPENIKTKTGLINKGNSRFYTKAGKAVSSCTCKKHRAPGVIYLGEPTEGLLD